jgi:hypothetical protein
MPTIVIASWYDEFAERYSIHVLGGGAPRFYTRSMPESNLEVAKSERYSSLDKSRGENEVEVLSGWRGRGGGTSSAKLLHEPVPRSRGTFKVAYTSN